MPAILAVCVAVMIPSHGAVAQPMPYTLRGAIQRPDLVRYNRVEALSLGLRGQLRVRAVGGRPYTVRTTVRVGVADLHPNVRAEVIRDGLAHRFVLGMYEELAPIDEGAGHFSLSNSALAFLFGRDDGDYYRRTGLSLEWSPPAADRRWFLARVYSERHQAELDAIHFALLRSWKHFDFRPNIVAMDGYEHGLLVRLAPRWGTDPDLAEVGLELVGQGGFGETEYARAAAGGDVRLPIARDVFVSLEVGGGTSWGTPPTERLWYLGGSRTLRGHDPRALGGTAFLRGRAQLIGRLPLGRVSAFYDAGWAGVRSDFDVGDGLDAVGLGLGLVDDLIRFDAAYALRDPTGLRFDLYLAPSH